MEHTITGAMNIFQARKTYEDLTISDFCVLDQENVFNGCG